jgi:hypothetical protein
MRSSLDGLSTRGWIGPDQRTLNTGFVISGPAPVTVILRGIGPSLAAAGVDGALADPTLDLYDSNGNLIASNDNWRETQEHELFQTGRFKALQPTDDLESAIAISLPAGEYVAVVSGKNGITGVGLAEVYADSQGADFGFSYVSARGSVVSNSALTSTITVGDGGASFIVRALGKSLTDDGISNALPDPVLEIYDDNGTLLASNDDWVADGNLANQLIAAGSAPKNPLESAISISLPPGNYSFVVRSKDGATGTALLDISTTP